MLRYDTMCHRCGSICWGEVPLLGKGSNQNMKCPNCDFIVIQFSQEEEDS